MSLALNKFDALNELNRWNKPSGSEARIFALESIIKNNLTVNRQTHHQSYKMGKQQRQRSQGRRQFAGGKGRGGGRDQRQQSGRGGRGFVRAPGGRPTFQPNNTTKFCSKCQRSGHTDIECRTYPAQKSSSNFRRNQKGGRSNPIMIEGQSGGRGRSRPTHPGRVTQQRNHKNSGATTGQTQHSNSTHIANETIQQQNQQQHSGYNHSGNQAKFFANLMKEMASNFNFD